jgi:hypothetical protein
VHQSLDDLGIHERSAAGDGANGSGQLGAVVEAVLEEVGATVGPALEQRERVDRLEN